jgi:hypothetical protein
LHPRNTLVSNPDSHSPLYSRVESTVVFVIRDSLLELEGTLAGVGRCVGPAHAVAKSKAVDRRRR